MGRQPAGRRDERAAEARLEPATRVLPDRITWTGSGYRFEIAADELDIARFEALLAKDTPRDALALWRGPALGEFVDEEFARGEAVRLSEMRVVAIEDGIDRELDVGTRRRSRRRARKRSSSSSRCASGCAAS